MAMIGKVLRMHRRDKKSVREIVKATSLARNTVRKYLRVRISGSAMREAGIDDGDLAQVDRAIDATHGQVVIAIHHDEFLCRRLHRRGEALGLQATDSSVADIWASDVDAFDIQICWRRPRFDPLVRVVPIST